MTLPIRTTLEDISALCSYLATKPTGATTAEAKAVVDKKRLDTRKIVALKSWGLIEQENGRMKLTDAGRRIAKDNGAHRAPVLLETIKRINPYAAVVERAVHSGESTITAVEVAAHWHEHFGTEVSNSEKILNDQAVCFFQVAEGADLGKLTIGRKGQPTRFDFLQSAVRAFVQGKTPPITSAMAEEFAESAEEATTEFELQNENEDEGLHTGADATNNRVFITHGKNTTIPSQIKELVAFGKFEPIVATEHETSAKPIPEKVLDDMRNCRAAVIHVGSEGAFIDEQGNKHTQINPNVLIEIGAAMALYGKDFILLVEEGVQLPSNLQGLYECRYKGDELSMPATMKLLKAFNDFK